MNLRTTASTSQPSSTRCQPKIRMSPSVFILFDDHPVGRAPNPAYHGPVSLSTGISRFVLWDRQVSGEMTLVHQRKNTFTYDGERRIRLVTDPRTREVVRASGNRLYIWGSRASIAHADVLAPPQQLRFDRLRTAGSFDLFVDRSPYLEGFVVRHRRLLRPRFYVRPFLCDL